MTQSTLVMPDPCLSHMTSIMLLRVSQFTRTFRSKESCVEHWLGSKTCRFWKEVPSAPSCRLPLSSLGSCFIKTLGSSLTRLIFKTISISTTHLQTCISGCWVSDFVTSQTISLRCSWRMSYSIHSTTWLTLKWRMFKFYVNIGKLKSLTTTCTLSAKTSTTTSSSMVFLVRRPSLS